MMPRDTHAQAKFYTVTMYTGQQVGEQDGDDRKEVRVPGGG